MGAAARDVPDALRLERLDEARLVAGEARAVAELAVVALAPRKYPLSSSLESDQFVG